MEERSRVELHSLGKFEDGNYVLNDEEITWISKHFLLMQ
jgi:hypothetical protein